MERKLPRAFRVLAAEQLRESCQWGFVLCIALVPFFAFREIGRAIVRLSFAP
jgi:hypothetical protein